MEKSDDLVVLAADKQMQEALRGLLSQPEALQIRPISFSIYTHPRHDAGCRTEGHQFLRSFHEEVEHALVLFDYHGCGAEHEATPEEIESIVEEGLSRSGWSDRARCVVIDPELEVWVWSDSPEVDRCLGWGERSSQVQEWLRENGWWPQKALKPPQPKAALEHALEEVRQPRSSALFRDLASAVSFARCDDPSFQQFQFILRDWFPPSWKPADALS